MNSFKNISLRPNSSYLSYVNNLFSYKGLLAIIILILLIIGIYFLYHYFSKKMKSNYSENSENIPVEGNTSNSSKQAELMLFTATWCPICRNSKPDWDEVKTEYNGKTINGYTLIFTEVDCTTETPDTEKMMNKFKIEGFPTIKLLKNKKSCIKAALII